MKKYIVLLLMIISVSFTGCVRGIELKVLTTAYPIEYLAKRIGGDDLDVMNISSNTIIQRATLDLAKFNRNYQDATTLLRVAELENYMPLFYETFTNQHKIEMTDLSNSLSNRYGRSKRINTGEGESIVVESGYYTGGVFNSVDKYTKDPFIWFDPIAMLTAASSIKDEFIRLDAINKDKYQRNYEQLEIELSYLSAEFVSVRNNTKGMEKKIVTMTNSFGNYQNTLDLQLYPIIVSKFGVLPNAEQLEAIKQTIIDNNVIYIADEPNLPDDAQNLYNQLVAELNLQPVKLHNLALLTATDIEEKHNYIKIMYDNLAVIEAIAQ